jgi:hypothetical protein
MKTPEERAAKLLKPYAGKMNDWDLLASMETLTKEFTAAESALREAIAGEWDTADDENPGVRWRGRDIAEDIRAGGA